MEQVILLADDSITIQKVVELTFLDEPDLRVICVRDGRLAFKEIKKQKLALVMVDVFMPEKNGYEVCAFAKSSQPGIPVILLAGTFEPFDETKSRAAGADCVIKKPFDSQELFVAARRLLSRYSIESAASFGSSLPADQRRPSESQSSQPKLTIGGDIGRRSHGKEPRNQTSRVDREAPAHRQNRWASSVGRHNESDGAMKVFISWSGERSLVLAKALREWLPLVLHYVKPWLSDTDISAGSRWETEVEGELEKTDFGIICLTKENSQSPWVIFEAGAMSRIVTKTAVCPYLIDLQFQDLHGPLAQFQAKKAEKSSTFELLKSINKRADPPLAAETLDELFIALWPKLAKCIKSAKLASHGPNNPRKTGEVLEDVVFSVRRLDYKIDLLATLFSRRLSQLRKEWSEEASSIQSTASSSSKTSRTTSQSIFDAATVRIPMEGPGIAFQPQSLSADEEAQRLARLLVSDIKLYNEEEVDEGWAAGDIYRRVGDEIEKARQAYEERVDPGILNKKDYFYEQLVAILADGDEKRLGGIAQAPPADD